MCGTGESALTVVGETVGDDSLLWGRAWREKEALVICEGGEDVIPNLLRCGDEATAAKTV